MTNPRYWQPRIRDKVLVMDLYAKNHGQVGEIVKTFPSRPIQYEINFVTDVEILCRNQFVNHEDNELDNWILKRIGAGPNITRRTRELIRAAFDLGQSEK